MDVGSVEVFDIARRSVSIWQSGGFGLGTVVEISPQTRAFADAGLGGLNGAGPCAQQSTVALQCPQGDARSFCNPIYVAPDRLKRFRTTAIGEQGTQETRAIQAVGPALMQPVMCLFSTACGNLDPALYRYCTC